ncbi:hypothetical protein N0V88_000804 [Collariella sp. IMI 366227]|nr:hypothetical protein N0V88_000804 [Collariella sp. IMI 366227]
MAARFKIDVFRVFPRTLFHVGFGPKILLRTSDRVVPFDIETFKDKAVYPKALEDPVNYKGPNGAPLHPISVYLHMILNGSFRAPNVVLYKIDKGK